MTVIERVETNQIFAQMDQQFSALLASEGNYKKAMNAMGRYGYSLSTIEAWFEWRRASRPHVTS
ncbi:MAG: hypothetical protein UX04_C0006G0047 [Microgenomates group bacterium GW2011_GWF2_45_18]|nr:MAG: hypothetical protein UW18_C0006G0048 [Microgenomates group bacterium GW2011_GWF1_44_10]KKU01512.1 MAG: hypothetical protein UX04_C0006G0047 [Microgenomates group bacterium GW2011_GWF2_45_18]OGJ41438.1 MAG: hypothetical protein A2378_00255 [Candidatus Pacebacteria bacterium RIFOXYB1_FULL_44_10]HAU99420.1 hypothetical protein [Candidatus Paceibacterota bacterium]HAX01574.1 hypothetical protein [Candidatus Paceibacterota bacterium]